MRILVILGLCMMLIGCASSPDCIIENTTYTISGFKSMERSGGFSTTTSCILILNETIEQGSYSYSTCQSKTGDIYRVDRCIKENGCYCPLVYYNKRISIIET